MAKGNDRGKDNERAFARFMSVWLDIQVRRNDARVNADDSARNSDVDVKHQKLQVDSKLVRVGEPGSTSADMEYRVIRRGITAELKYRSNEFSTIYKWMGELPSTLSVLLVNDSLLICRLADFPQIYKTFVQSQPILPFRVALHTCILHKDVATEFKVLREGSEQSARYGKTKKLFPIQVIRMKGKKQLVVIRTVDIRDLNVERGYIYE